MPHDRARSAREVLRPVPKLRDQLQPREGHGRGATSKRTAARADHPIRALGGIREADVVASPAIRSAVEAAASMPHGGRASAPSSTWTLAAAAVLCLAGYVFVYATGRAGAADPLRRVQLLRLPALVVHLPRPLAGRVARDCCGGEFPAYTAIIRWPGTRRWVNAHPIGVAVMQAPFFAVAHALTKWTNLSADGFTLYYQHAAGLAGLLLDRRRAGGPPAAAAAPFHRSRDRGDPADDPARHEPLSLRHVRQLLQPRVLVLSVRRCSSISPSGGTTRATGRERVLLGVVGRPHRTLTRHTNLLFLVCLPLFGVTDSASFDRGCGSFVTTGACSSRWWLSRRHRDAPARDLLPGYRTRRS